MMKGSKMGKDDISLVSTTDSAEEVQAALTGAPVAEAAPVVPAEPVVAATAPVVPVVAPVAAAPEKPAVPEAAAEQTPEQKADAHLSARDKRIAKINAEIAEATAKKHETRRDVEAELAQLETLRTQRAALEASRTTAPAPATAPVPDVVGPAPLLEDFSTAGKTYEEWIAATVAWDGAKREAAFAAREAAFNKRIDDAEARITQRQTQADAERRQQEFDNSAAQNAHSVYETKLEAFKTAGATDFDEVLLSAKDAVNDLIDDLGPQALNVIDRYTVYDADNGPAINRFLATNPDEMRRIAALPIPQQLAALGKLDNRLDPATTTPARVPVVPVSHAPSPIKPVGGSPTASSVPPEDEPYPIFRARREREERAARGITTG
jgi:hypothetical protein